MSILSPLQQPVSAQVVTYCPGTKFYKYPHNAKSVSPEIPEGGLQMVSASDIWNILNRDPRRINGWVEVFLVNGRGGDRKGPYWITEKAFGCGRFVGT